MFRNLLCNTFFKKGNECMKKGREILLKGVSIITAIMIGVGSTWTYPLAGEVKSSKLQQTAMKVAKDLKIMSNPPTITEYKESLNTSPYKWQPVTINGEVNPVYTSYNSTLKSDNQINLIGSNQKGNNNNYAVEFTVDCKEFVFRSSSCFRISVDEGNGYELTSYEGYTDNPFTWSNFKVEFKEKKKRNIRIELTLAFWGVYLQEQDTISKIQRPSKERAVFVGTSITQGIYRYKNQPNSIVGYPSVICNMLDFECINNGIGGTGYVTKGAYTTFYDRLVYAVKNLNPDIIFIEGGPNDVDRYSNEEIVEEAKRCHAYLKANAPNTKVIIIGLYHHTGYEYLFKKHIDLNEKLREEALLYQLPYIDLLTGDTVAADGRILTEGFLKNPNGNSYITGDGNTKNPKGNGNADLYVDTDNYHPSLAGYRFLGEKLSKEIVKILNDTPKKEEEEPTVPITPTEPIEPVEPVTPSEPTEPTQPENPEPATPQKQIQVTKLTLTATSTKLAAGKKIKLNLTVFPKNAENQAVTYTSSNNKYATVDAFGRVTLKKAGAGKTVTITVTAKDGSGRKTAIKIKIMKDSVKSIKMIAPKASVKAGKTITLKTIIKTTGKSANKTLKWKSSNTSYATVSKNGKVTLKKAGKGKKVTITAMTTDGTNKKSSITIKIQ